MAGIKTLCITRDPDDRLVVLHQGDEAPAWFEGTNPEVIETKKPARRAAKKGD